MLGRWHEGGGSGRSRASSGLSRHGRRGSRSRWPVTSPGRSTAQHLIELALIEAGQDGRPASSVFVVDLDEAGNEELLLLVCLGLPVVWLAQRYEEPDISSPFSVVRIDRRARVGLDSGKVVQVPCLADREGAVLVLLRLMYSHAAGFSDGNNDCALLLCSRGPLVRCWRRGRRA